MTQRPAGEDVDVGLRLASHESLPESAERDVRAARIPDVEMPALREAVKRQASGTGWVYLLLFTMVLARLLNSSSSSASEMGAAWLVFAGLPVATMGAAVWMTRRWVLIRRDLRERQVRVEEGVLARKSTEERVTYREDSLHEPASSTASRSRRVWQWIDRGLGSVLRSGDPDDWPEDRRVRRTVGKARIGKRTVEVGSIRLFNELTVGVRYRMFLSEHTGHLVAIEPAEWRAPGPGYRGAPPTATRPGATS